MVVQNSLQSLVIEVSSEHISLGPKFKGNWGVIRNDVLKLSRYKYTSPPLEQLLPGEKFRHGVDIHSYVVTKTEKYEARTGPLVWARAKDVRAELVVVVESNDIRYTSQLNPEIYQKVSRDFGDKDALIKRGQRRKAWLIPISIRWK